HPAHRGNPVHGLIRTHELERRDGTEPVSVANQAAAFDKISRSSRSTRFSRLSRVSSSRSLLVSPSLRSPVSSCACLTHCRMLSTDGSNSRANSFSDRPARASSTIRRRYSAGYGGCVFGIALLLAFLPNTLHETGSTPREGRAGRQDRLGFAWRGRRGRLDTHEPGRERQRHSGRYELSADLHH